MSFSSKGRQGAGAMDTMPSLRPGCPARAPLNDSAHDMGPAETACPDLTAKGPGGTSTYHSTLKGLILP